MIYNISSKHNSCYVLGWQKQYVIHVIDYCCGIFSAMGSPIRAIHYWYFCGHSKLAWKLLVSINKSCTVLSIFLIDNARANGGSFLDTLFNLINFANVGHI